MSNQPTFIKPNFFNYIITVKFNKDYFDNPNEPLTKKLEFSSVGERTLQEIQRCYPNSKVLNVEKIKSNK